jgi:asparaginyl-tRNA synthetase
MLTHKIVEGRITNKRNLGGIIFLDIDAAPGDVNVIARKDSSLPSLYEKIEALQLNDFCRLEVTAKENDWVICQLLLHIKKQQDYFWNSRQLEIVRAYAFLLDALREYFNTEGYTEVRLPSIHAGKNKGDIFELDYFGHTARLTSSNALFLDIYAVQLQKAFSIQKCFRAEKSHTNRHLSEFDMLEAARLYCSLEDAMTAVEDLLKFVLDKFAQSTFAGISPLDFPALKEKKFAVIPYKEIEQHYKLEGKGLGMYEREIAAKEPVFVKNFPRNIASWTAKPGDDKYTRSFNLLLPGVGEAVEGTERQTHREEFQHILQTAGAEEQLGWYLNMLPYSDFLLSGFGMGVERLAMWLLGLKNIREIHPIYRDTGFSELKEKAV